MHGAGLGAWGWGDCLDQEEVKELEACIKGHGTCDLDEGEVAELSRLPFCDPPDEFWDTGWFGKERTDNYAEWLANTIGIGTGRCTDADNAYQWQCTEAYDPGPGNANLHHLAKRGASAGPNRFSNFNCWALQKDPRVWGNILGCRAPAAPPPSRPPPRSSAEDEYEEAGLGLGVTAAIVGGGLGAAYLLWRKLR